MSQTFEEWLKDYRVGYLVGELTLPDLRSCWEGAFAAGVASQQAASTPGLDALNAQLKVQLAEKDREIERLNRVLLEFVPLDQYNTAQAELEEK